MKRLVLILLYVFTSALTFAAHFYGGGIEYTNIGSRKWKVTLKFISDCALPTSVCNNFSTCTMSVSAVPNPFLNPVGATANPSSISATLALVKIEDINKIEVLQLGNIAKNYCTNLGQQTPGNQSPSWEVYTFEGILDMSTPLLNNTTCAYWDIYTSGTARSSNLVNISSSGNSSYTLKSTLNIFHKSTISEGLKCNSAKMNNHYLFRVTAGDMVSYNPAAIDIDGDSLSYFIGQAYKDNITPASYAAPFSNTYPFPLNQTAEPHISYPQGINPYLIMDGTTGTLSFNAVNNSATSFTSSIVIGIKQWSKDTLGNPLLVGTQEYEFPVMVVSNLGNNGILLKNTEAVNNSFKTTYSMLPTDTLVVNVTAKDPDINVTSTRTDTTKIIQVFMSDSLNTFITHTNGTSAQDAITIKYAPGISKLNTTQSFTVLAVDNNFPMQMASRQFNVRIVDGITSANIAKTIDSCGQVTLSYYNPINVKNVVWNICTTPNEYTFNNQVLTYTSNGPLKLPPFSRVGKYFVRLTLYRKEPENASPVFVYDTIDIRKPTFSFHIADTIVCKNTLLSLSLPSGNYQWKNLDRLTTKNTNNVFSDTIFSNTSYSVSGLLNEQTYQGCSVNDTFNVVIYSEPNTSLLQQYSICPNSSVSLNAKPTNMDSVAFAWSTNQTDSSINVSSAGNYFVTITNLRNGCSTKRQIQINTGSITPLTIEKIVESCRTDSLRLSATGADLYAWKVNNTTLSNQPFCDVIPDSNLLIVVHGKSLNQGVCDKSDTMRLIVIPKATFSGIIGNKTPFLNTPQTYTTSANQKYQYTWEALGGSLQQQTDSSASIIWQNLGKSIIKITASHPNCKSVTFVDSVFVIQQVGLQENTLSDFQLFPNPTNESLNIKTQNPIKSLEIFDVNSRLISTPTVSGEQLFESISVSGLSNGIYYIRIRTTNNLIFISRFSVVH